MHRCTNATNAPANGSMQVCFSLSKNAHNSHCMQYTEGRCWCIVLYGSSLGQICTRQTPGEERRPGEGGARGRAHGRSHAHRKLLHALPWPSRAIQEYGARHHVCLVGCLILHLPVARANPTLTCSQALNKFNFQARGTKRVHNRCGKQRHRPHHCQSAKQHK